MVSGKWTTWTTTWVVKNALKIHIRERTQSNIKFIICWVCFHLSWSDFSSTAQTSASSPLRATVPSVFDATSMYGGYWRRGEALLQNHHHNHVNIIRKELPQHSFTVVVSEASTPTTPPLAWSTELPLPTSKHVSRQEYVIRACYKDRG